MTRRVTILCVVMATWCLALQAETATIREGLFVVAYRAGEEALAQNTVSVLRKAQEEFAEHLSAGDKSIQVIICSTPGEFSAHGQRLAKLGADGFARSRQGVIVVKAPYLRQQGWDYSGTLRHELVHVLLARNVDFDCLPRWLNEGLAMVVGKDYRWQSSFRVAKMYLQGRIIPYFMLELSFLAPRNRCQFSDAYAQSLSMTNFLMERMGEDAFWEMVRAMNTMPFDEALLAKTGLTPRTLCEAWRKSLWKVALVSSLVSGFSVFQLMALLVLVAYWKKRRRGKKILQRWAEEEAEEDGLLLFPWELEGQEQVYPWEEDEEEWR